MTNVQPPKPPNGRTRPARGNGTTEMDPRQLLRALTALGRGDFTARLPDDWVGLGGKIADAFNGVVERNQRLAQELDRISKAVGKEGKLNQRASIGDVSGSWADSVRAVNALIGDLAAPLSESSRVITAVAHGDLSQAMAMEVEGRALQGEIGRASCRERV